MSASTHLSDLTESLKLAFKEGMMALLSGDVSDAIAALEQVETGRSAPLDIKRALLEAQVVHTFFGEEERLRSLAHRLRAFDAHLFLRMAQVPITRHNFERIFSALGEPLTHYMRRTVRSDYENIMPTLEYYDDRLHGYLRARKIAPLPQNEVWAAINRLMRHVLSHDALLVGPSALVDERIEKMFNKRVKVLENGMRNASQVTVAALAEARAENERLLQRVETQREQLAEAKKREKLSTKFDSTAGGQAILSFLEEEGLMGSGMSGREIELQNQVQIQAQTIRTLTQELARLRKSQ